MKLVKITYALIALLTVTSCHSDFELEGMDAEEKLVLYCMPAAGVDTTLIQLSKSLPVTGTGLPPRGIPGARIRFEVNGVEKPVYWNEDDSCGILRPQCYYVVTEGLKEGDAVRIEAEADAMRPVLSETVVPAPFPVKDIVLAVKHDSEPKMQFRITFEDSSETDDYYAVNIIRRYTLEEGHYEYNYQTHTGEWKCYKYVYDMGGMTFDLKDEPLIYNKVGLDATFDFDYNYYQKLYIWTDEQIPGQEYTLRLTTGYSWDTGGYPDWEDTSETNKYEYWYSKYKVRLYRLSPDLYKFLKAMNDIDNNELGHNGLAPIRNHYSNIINGFGVMGACQVYESAWLDNPK